MEKIKIKWNGFRNKNYHCIDCLYAQDNKSRLSSSILKRNKLMSREEKLDFLKANIPAMPWEHMCLRKGFYASTEEFKTKKVCSSFQKRIDTLSFEEQEHYIDQDLQRRKVVVNTWCPVIMAIITCALYILALISLFK